MELELTGNDGEIRASYQVAAKLPAWRVTTIGPRLYLIEAVGCSATSAWLGYRPLTLRVPVSKTMQYEFDIEGEVGPPDPADEDRRMKLFASGMPRIVPRR